MEFHPKGDYGDELFNEHDASHSGANRRNWLYELGNNTVPSILSFLRASSAFALAVSVLELSIIYHPSRKDVVLCPIKGIFRKLTCSPKEFCFNLPWNGRKIFWLKRLWLQMGVQKMT